MSHFHAHPDLFNLPILLTEEEKQNPSVVLTRFCNDYSLFELRDYHWNQLETCLTTDNTSFSEPEQRADLLYRYQQLEKVLEAIFLLFKPSTPEK